MKSVTHKITLILLAMSVVPIMIGLNALYGLRTAGNALTDNDRAFQYLSGLINTAGDTISESTALQENMTRVAAKINRAHEETATALHTISDSVLPRTSALTRIRVGVGDVSMAERAILLAVNMRHLEQAELRAIRQKQYNNIDRAAKSIQEAMSIYQEHLESVEEKAAWNDFSAALAAWWANHDDFMKNIDDIDRLVDDLIRGGPVFASASREAYDTIFVRGRDARARFDDRMAALEAVLAETTRDRVKATSETHTRSNSLLRDLERESAAAMARSDALGAQIAAARATTGDASKAATEALAATSSRFRILMSVGGLAVFIALVFGILIARKVGRPIKVAAIKMTCLAKGEPTEDVTPELLRGKDEIGQLARAMQDLIDSYRHEIAVANSVAEGDFTRPIPLRSANDQLGMTLKTMLTRTNSALAKVSNIVVRVGKGASQVSGASQSLSRNAQTSAAALEEITQSVFNVDQQAKDNAKNSREASKLATASREAAQRGYSAVNDLVKAMAEIKDAGGKIATVAKLIDDIAFQTNLLALNAAVEAARAGRYGKGFTVVADEVRNLSGRSAKAARETGQMVAAMTDRMLAGMEMAEKSDEEFRDIVTTVSRVEEIFSSITDASTSQSQAVAQIAKGLEQIDDVIQENTHNAEETALSAEWLSRQATELRASVSRFKLSEDDGATNHYVADEGAMAARPVQALAPFDRGLTTSRKEAGKGLLASALKKVTGGSKIFRKADAETDFPDEMPGTRPESLPFSRTMANAGAGEDDSRREDQA